MNTNRIFDWESSHIDRGVVRQPKKKKSWPGKIKDAFTPGRPQLTDMRESISEVFSNYKASVTDPRKKLGYETAILITEKADSIGDIDHFDMGFLIARGAEFGKTVAGKAIAGPIGLAIPGFTNHPVLDKIKIEDTPVRLEVAANTVLLMDGARDENLHSAFPNAAEAFIREVASYKDDSSRACAAEKIGEILKTPGISDDDRRNISRDSIMILKGNVDPVWVLSKSEEYADKKSDSALKFADYLKSNLNTVMDPIEKGLEKASSGKTGARKVKAILLEGRRLRKKMDPEMVPLISISALKKLKSESEPISSNAGKILDMIIESDDRNISRIYANMALNIKSPDLSLKFGDLLNVGKEISLIKDKSSKIAVAEWFDSNIDLLESVATDPREKKIVQSTKNILSKIDPKSKQKFAGAFFNAIESDKISQGPVLTAKLGYESVKGMSEEYSSNRQEVVKSAKVFISELTNQGGEVGKLMTQVSALLDEADDRVGAKITKDSLLKASSGVGSAFDELTKMGYDATKSLSEEYSSNRETKIKQQKLILEKTKQLTSNSDTIRFIEGAVSSVDGIANYRGCKNGQEALKILTSGNPVNPVVDLANIFCKTIKPMSREYSSERKNKTSSTVEMLNVLKDAAIDPGTKKRIDMALDVIAKIEEPIMNSKNEPVNISSYRGFEIGLGVMESISLGKTEDPGMEIGKIGYNFTKNMSTEYTSERQKLHLMCRRFFNMVEKHAEDPAQKKAGQAFRELMDDLGDRASSYIGVYGLQMLGEGREFKPSEMANPSLKYFNSISEEYSSERNKKTSAAGIILKNLGKHAEDDFDKKVLISGNKVIRGMESTSYGYRVVKPLLKLLQDKPECSLATAFSNMGLEFIQNNFDSTTNSGQNAKTTTAGAFLSQIAQVTESRVQRAIAQSMSMYCRKSEPRKGYLASRGAFAIISELEGKSDESIDMEEIISKIEQNCPEETRSQLSQFLKKSIASVFIMKQGVEKAGEGLKEIKHEEAYVVIGGVKLKKSRS